jgi:hypothetical protein
MRCAKLASRVQNTGAKFHNVSSSRSFQTQFREHTLNEPAPISEKGGAIYLSEDIANKWTPDTFC